jgi:hypothetical protein
MGQGEPESVFPIRNRDVSGGLNNKLFATDIGDNQSQQLKNIRTDVLGIRQTRPGCSIAATGITFGPVLALKEYTNQAGSSKLLAVAPGGSAGDHARLYDWDGTGSTFSYVGPMTGYTGGTARDYSIVNAQDIDYTVPASTHVAVISDDAGVNLKRWYYDGASLAQTDWPPAANKAVFAHTYAFDRVLATGTGKWKGALFYSYAARGVTASFTNPTTDFFRFGTDSSQAVVAVEVLRKNVVVFMQDRFDILDTSYKGYNLTVAQTGNTTADLRPGSNWSVVGGHETIGCGSRKSIANAGEDLFFADQYGNIRSLARTIQDEGQGVSTLPVSDPIQGWIDRINPAAINKIVCHVYNRWLVVGLPIDSATDADHVFVLDTIRGRQTKQPVWDGPWLSSDVRAFKPYSMTNASLNGATADADKSPTLYVGSTVATDYTDPGLVYRTFVGTSDAGNAIEYQEITKRQSAGTFEIKKAWERVMPQLVGSGAATMHVEANLDAKGFEHVGYVSLFGDAPVLPVDLPFTLGGAGVVAETLSLEDMSAQRSRDIAFRFTVTVADVVTKMLGYSVFGHMENWDRTPSDG